MDLWWTYLPLCRDIRLVSVRAESSIINVKKCNGQNLNFRNFIFILLILQSMDVISIDLFVYCSIRIDNWHWSKESSETVANSGLIFVQPPIRLFYSIKALIHRNEFCKKKTEKTFWIDGKLVACNSIIVWTRINNQKWCNEAVNVFFNHLKTHMGTFFSSFY